MQYRYRGTEIIVEAIQYDGKNWQEIRKFAGRDLSHDKGRADATLWMQADDGFNNLIVESGDWVVKDGKSLRKYNQEQFEARFTPA